MVFADWVAHFFAPYESEGLHRNGTALNGGTEHLSLSVFNIIWYSRLRITSCLYAWLGFYRFVLLETDGFGGMNVRHEIARSNQYDDADDECAGIEEQYPERIDFERHFADIVVGWVELDDAGALLNEAEGEGEYIADEQTLADDEDGKP